MYEIVRDLAALADAPDFSYGPAKVALTKQARAIAARKQARSEKAAAKAAAAAGGKQSCCGGGTAAAAAGAS